MASIENFSVDMDPTKFLWKLFESNRPKLILLVYKEYKSPLNMVPKHIMKVDFGT
jgi:hypothetical protein